MTDDVLLLQPPAGGGRVFIWPHGSKAILATAKQVKRFDKLVPPETRFDTFYAWCCGWFDAKPDATVDEFLDYLATRYELKRK